MSIPSEQIKMVPANEIDHAWYERTYSADQLFDGLKKQHEARAALEKFSPEMQQFLALAVGTNLKKHMGEPIDAEIVSDTDQFPVHNAELASLYRDETTDTDRLMVDSHAAIDFAKNVAQEDKHIKHLVVPGYKHVLARIPQGQSVLNKFSIKQGIKLEHLPEIRDKVIAEIAEKQHEIEKEKQKVYKSADKDPETLARELELLNAVRVFFDAVLTPPQEEQDEGYWR